ncbi:hypothetical protein BJ970_005860 [Saccharopolyspora phatthalungensis]|uniref:Tn3 transposase DDE domain-containing protein n=1 Tax=Saccharopolyspora phatthalungensis TaxID=664693 RepID=A0A840QE63_9PSEU|nr:Tn3 family transposase [Saccharopolyspora phatthalungensis]MBB5158261.1 hypothetical protein [Saccharopolyspora phatthalungensis]
MDWRAYTFCVLEQFHRCLRRRDIFAVNSSKWGDPRAKLLAGKAWITAKPVVLASLNLPPDPDDHPDERAELPDATFREVTAGLGDNTAVRFDEHGRLRRPGVHPGHRRRSPPGRPAHHHRRTAGVRGVQHRLDPGHQAQRPGTDQEPVAHVDATYLRMDTIKAANAALIDEQARNGLAQVWGGGHVASVDGMRFVVPVQTINARHNPHYWGQHRGATWLNMLNDQAAGLAGKVVTGTPRDSLHVLDVLYDRDGGQKPQVIVTDTAS